MAGLFNRSINRCLFDLELFDYKNWPDDDPEDIAFPPYLMAHTILGQARRRGRDNHLLTAIWDAVDYCLGCTMDHSSIPTVRICEAVARHMGSTIVNILKYLGTGRLPTKTMLANYDSFLNGDMNVHSHRLSAAIITGNRPQVCELLGLEAIDVNTENRYFGYPLHLAAAAGNLEITELLLEHGADVRERANEDRNGPFGPSKWRFTRKSFNRTSGSVVQVACLGGHQELVEMLLKIEDVRALVTEGELEMSLHNAVFSRNSYLVEFLLSFTDHTFTKKAAEMREHVYFMAAKAGNTTLIKKMLDQGADPNSTLEIGRHRGFVERERTALYFAMDRSHALDTMRFLLDNGADPNFEGKNHKEGTGVSGYFRRAYPTIYWAIRTGNVEMVELLLRYGAKETTLEEDPMPGGMRASFYKTAVVHGQDGLAQKFRELDGMCSSSPPEESGPAGARKITGSEPE